LRVRQASAVAILLTTQQCAQRYWAAYWPLRFGCWLPVAEIDVRGCDPGHRLRGI